MKFVEETVVDEFLPTVRAMLASELRDRGLTQREVADALGVSQAAVSKYVHGEVSTRDEIRADERVQETVERVAEGLATGDLSPTGALIEFEVLIRRLEDGDLLARLHEEAMPALAEREYDFALHDPEGPMRERERTLASVRRGLRRLTGAAGFAKLVPNVGSNLVEALPDATGVGDVAGVPGRIVDVKGRAMVPADPEFGASQHVAEVLLAARAAGATARAAANVRYDPELVTTLRENGHETIEFDPDASADPVEAALAGRDLGETFVVYQTGAMGIEPVAYVLGPDAPTVADVIRGLL